jgi:zinc protease
MTRIAFLLALVVACGGGGTSVPQTPTVPAKPKTPSTAEEVIEASLAAQGGRDKLAKITSLKSTATILIAAANLKGKLTAYNAPPRDSLEIFDLPGIGKTQSGTHDDLAWEMNPITGARIIDGAEKRIALRNATFNADLMWKELYPKTELAGVVDFNGTQSYKVIFTAAEGDSVTRYYAKDTLLPIGTEMIVKSQMGEMPLVLVESDFRDIQGLKFPYKVQRKDATLSAEITVDEIELSPKLDPTLFAVPPEIQALQKPKG